MHLLQIPARRILSLYSPVLPICDRVNILRERNYYRDADKSLVSPGKKQTAPVKVWWAEEGTDLARVGRDGGLL